MFELVNQQSEFANEQMEIAAKPKKPRIPPEQRASPEPRDEQGEALARQVLAKIQQRTGIPIEEVVSRISDNVDPSNASQGGFVKYSQLVKEAKNGNLTNQSNPGFISLVTASAETLVYKAFRDSRTEQLDIPIPIAAVIHDPVAQTKSANSILPAPLQIIVNGVLSRIGKQTPDILLIAPTEAGTIKGIPTPSYPALRNLVNLDNPTSSTFKKETYVNQTLIAPVEVTVSGRYEKIKEKIDKFREYKNPYPNSTAFAYVPVLVLDYDKYMGLPDKDKIKIAKAMKNVGGVIQLEPNLVNASTQLATKLAQGITQAEAARQRQSQKKTQGLTPDSTTPTIQTTSNAQSSNSTQITNSSATPQAPAANVTANIDNLTTSSTAESSTLTSLTPAVQLTKPVRISLAELTADDDVDSNSNSNSNSRISFNELTGTDSNNNGKVSLAELTGTNNNGKVSLAELTAPDNQNLNQSNSPQLAM